MIFKFIDRVLEQTDNKIIAIKNVTIKAGYIAAASDTIFGNDGSIPIIYIIHYNIYYNVQ